MLNFKGLTFSGVAAFLFILILTQRNNSEMLDTSQANFVGRESCIECHTDEYQTWKGSDHDNAMDTATAETVLGDSNNAEFERNGFVSKF